MNRHVKPYVNVPERGARNHRWRKPRRRCTALKTAAGGEAAVQNKSKRRQRWQVEVYVNRVTVRRNRVHPVPESRRGVVRTKWGQRETNR